MRAVEFKTNGAPIHHAVIRVDPAQAARHKDGQDGQPGFDGMSWQGSAGSRRPVHRLGAGPRADRRRPKACRGVSSAAPISSSSCICSRRTCRARSSRPSRSSSPTRRRRPTPLTLKMGSKLIDIPAGKRDYVVTDTYELPVPFDLLSVYPHAHYLGKEMRVTATLPDGAVKSLLSHQALELSLAAGLPLRHADSASRRHDADDAVHVRQLGAESREPASPAGARAARAAVDGRDGGAGPAGPAEVAGGCRDARAVVRRSRRRRERRARRDARARVAQQRRIPGVPGRESHRGRAVCRRDSAPCRRRSGWTGGRPPRTTISARR